MKTGTQLRDEGIARAVDHADRESLVDEVKAVNVALQKLSAAIEKLAAKESQQTVTEFTQPSPACSTSLLRMKGLDGVTRRLVEAELEHGKLLRVACPQAFFDLPLSEPTRSQVLDLCGQFLRTGYQLAYTERHRPPDSRAE